MQPQPQPQPCRGEEEEWGGGVGQAGAAIFLATTGGTGGEAAVEEICEVPLEHCLPGGAQACTGALFDAS